MKKSVFIVFISIMHAYFLSSGQAIIVDSTSKEPTLLQGLFLYENVFGGNNFEAAKDKHSEGKFKQLNTHFLKLGYAKSTFWLNFKINNQSKKYISFINYNFFIIFNSSRL